MSEVIPVKAYPTCCPLVRFSHIGIEDAARDGPCVHGKVKASLVNLAFCDFVRIQLFPPFRSKVSAALKWSFPNHFVDITIRLGSREEKRGGEGEEGRGREGEEESLRKGGEEEGRRGGG